MHLIIPQTLSRLRLIGVITDFQYVGNRGLFYDIQRILEAENIVLVAEFNLELCAISFSRNRPDAAIDLVKWYPSVNFVRGKTSNAKKVLRILNGEVVEDIPISKLVFDRCSDFRKNVYKEILRIPRGTTRTYSEIALLMNRPTAYRAVAQACGANILAVVIPCHRVIASGGSLGGYKWGVFVKRQLLDIESSSGST